MIKGIEIARAGDNSKENWRIIAWIGLGPEETNKLPGGSAEFEAMATSTVADVKAETVTSCGACALSATIRQDVPYLLSAEISCFGDNCENTTANQATLLAYARLGVRLGMHAIEDNFRRTQAERLIDPAAKAITTSMRRKPKR